MMMRKLALSKCTVAQLQQHHDTNKVNGETTDCNMNEAQTLDDTTCDLNDTFGTEENVVNLWQSGQ